MIVDSHTHIFQHWSGACGLPSREIHWKYIQKNLTRPFAKVYRARDGALADSKHLFREGDNTWDGLRDDINFRVGTYGRVEFTVEGEDYYIQYMPVGMAQIESTPEFMLAQMNVAGVDHCVLQTGFCYGYMNDYNALAQHHYPQKFTGLFHADEPLADTPQWMEAVTRAYHKLNLRGMHYETDTFSRYGFQWEFDDARFNDFWEMIESFNIPVFFQITPIPHYDQASYIGNLRRLDGLITRFPKIRWLLLMAPPVQYFVKNGKWEFPDQVAKTYAREDVQCEICFPIAWGGVWDYPFPEAQALIKDLRDKYGAQKLIWGSDMPNLERFCTYKQGLDYILRYCDYLTSGEKDLILGENLVELLGIKIPQTLENKS